MLAQDIGVTSIWRKLTSVNIAAVCAVLESSYFSVIEKEVCVCVYPCNVKCNVTSSRTG